MKDMTKGKPLTILLSFAIPMILSGMLQQCYNIADSIIAGRYAGVDALAAVGVSNPITQLFVGLGSGLGMGCGVVIAQLFGGKKMSQVKTAIFTALIAIISMSLVLMLAGGLLAPQISSWLNTPEDIFRDATSYLRIYMWGLPFLFIYNICNAIFNALGESKKPLYFLIFSTVLNIFLDLLFVAKFQWGVAGVAWATFIAQGLASLLAITVLLHRVKSIKEKYTYFDTILMGGMARQGIPTMFMMSVVSIGSLFVQALVNSNGSDFIAGYSAALKINGFFNVVIGTLGNAVSTFAGQNIGAGNYERPVQGLRTGLTINFGYVCFGILIMYLFGEQLISIFVDADASAAVYETGVGYLRVVSVGSLFFVILNNTCALCRGAGYVIASSVVTFVDLVFRVATAYLLYDVIGSSSVYWSISIGWFIGAGIALYYYFIGKWRNVKQQKEKKK